MAAVAVMRGAIDRLLVSLAMSALVCTAGCVKAQPASDTGNTLSPTGLPLPSPQQPLAYEPEMRQLFASDCVFCHGGYRVDAGYSMNTYEEIAAGHRSGLVITTQPGGSMYPYWSGSAATRQLKAELTRRWVEIFNMRRTR